MTSAHPLGVALPPGSVDGGSYDGSASGTAYENADVWSSTQAPGAGACPSVPSGDASAQLDASYVSGSYSADVPFDPTTPGANLVRAWLMPAAATIGKPLATLQQTGR